MKRAKTLNVFKSGNADSSELGSIIKDIIESHIGTLTIIVGHVCALPSRFEGVREVTIRS